MNSLNTSEIAVSDYSTNTVKVAPAIVDLADKPSTGYRRAIVRTRREYILRVLAAFGGRAAEMTIRAALESGGFGFLPIDTVRNDIRTLRDSGVLAIEKIKVALPQRPGNIWFASFADNLAGEMGVVRESRNRLEQQRDRVVSVTAGIQALAKGAVPALELIEPYVRRQKVAPV